MKNIFTLFISFFVSISLMAEECAIVDIKYSNPATDYTGKTVFTKRIITRECNTTTQKQVGCNHWKIETANGSLDYNASGVGTIYKQQDGSDVASQTMAMLENQFHLFSGWEGVCDQGTIWSNPFSDPMKLLSYAMIIYGAGISEGGSGSTLVDNTAKGIQDSVDTASKAVSDTFTEIGDQTSKVMQGIKDAITPEMSGTETLSALKDVDGLEGYISSTSSLSSSLTSIDTIHALKDVDIGLLEQLKEWNTIDALSIDMPWGTVMKFYYTDILELGMSLMPTEEELQSANDFNMAWMGDETTNQESVAYANCMASIGLSFPNMVSSFAGFDRNETSDELRQIHQNPLSLTYTQLAHLVSATDLAYVDDASNLPSKDDISNIIDNGYVGNSYAVISNDEDQQKVVLIAANFLAYAQAGQAICAGKISKAQNIVSQPSAKSGSSSGGIGKAIGTFAAKKVLMTLGFPAGLIASIVLDIVMSIDSINACHDIDDATKMGLTQMKTNRFLNFDQCYAKNITCQDKFLGSCILHRHHYCCYDQISTRIFAEGIKEELGLDMKVCDNIKLEDLKRISFIKCNEDQNATADHCFPADKWNEFAEQMQAKGVVNFNFEEAASQAINSLAIPRSICEVNTNGTN